jgi:hypothetical protein
VPVEVLGQPGDEMMTINFVVPTKKDVPPPIDVTPSPSPYEGQPADLSRPAIEPPRPRQQTPFGALWEKPKPRDWMG